MDHRDFARTQGISAWSEEDAVPGILAEIVNVQREYVRDGDPQRVREVLLDATLRVTASVHGFLGEIEWSDRGVPELKTRALRWADRQSLDADTALLVSQVIAEEATVIHQIGGDEPAGFLGLPLVSGDRLVGVIGVSSPGGSYDQRMADMLQPLLSTFAGIVESIHAAAARDRARSELESTASFLQSIFTSAASGILVVDDRLSVTTANPAAHAMLGFPDGALAGTPVLDLVVEPFEQRVGRLVGRRLRHGLRTPLSNIVVGARRLGGSEFPVEIAVSSMRIGDRLSMVVTFTDVTDRVEAQRTLAKAAYILDSTPDLVAWSESGEVIGYLNRGGRAALGTSPRRFEDLVAAESLELIEEGIRVAKAEGMWSGELVLDGQHPFPVEAVILSGHDGGSEFVALIAHDLSDRHEIDRLKDSFVSNVSHELRTPLTSILGYLEVLEDGGDLTEDQLGLIRVIQRNGDRLMNLIGRLLQTASIDKTEVRPLTDVNLEEVIFEVVAAHDLAAHQKGVGLRVATVPVVARVEPGELRSALDNLIGNAIKFTPSAGTVTVSIRQVGQEVVIDIIDTGIGISDQDLNRIRERFYRGVNARAFEIQGAGLGLAIADAVVERAGGVLTITSESDFGTTAQLRLPGADDGEQARRQCLRSL